MYVRTLLRCIVKGVPQFFEPHRGYLSKSSILHYITGAPLCGSEKLLPNYRFDLGKKKGIRMACSSVCRVMQGSCPFWWPQQLGVFLASARETAVEGNAAESRTRISVETLVFWLRVRR